MSALRFHLKRIRIESGLSQAELASQMGVSPSRLSRLESGEIEMTVDEAKEILSLIDSPPAHEYLDYLNVEWRELALVPFDHPDWQLLRKTEQLLSELRATKSDPALRAVFLRRLDLYEADLRHLADYILDPRHTVAVIGSIGIGKTTAICHLANLVIDEEASPEKKPVLEVGGGATTVCEVVIKPSPNFGLRIEPRDDDDIRKEVQDFAEFLLASIGVNESDAELGPTEDLSISREIERAIRNMSELNKTRRKSTDGKRIVEDPALELARTLRNSRELAIEILTRMHMPRRDRRDIWCPEENASQPLKWLQTTFAAINNGRNPEFGLPKRIEIALPYHVMRQVFANEGGGGSTLDLCIVDTKGIDQTAERADLERHFYDDRTVTVLCSGFNDAPEASAQSLLKRAMDAKAPDVEKKSLILVLPRAKEALAVKDEGGNLAESSEDGYELKREQVDLRLNGLGLPGLPCVFFNSHEEDPAGVRNAIRERIADLRNLHLERLTFVLARVRNLIENKADAERAEVMALAVNQIRTWISQHQDLPGVRSQVEDYLITAIGRSHPGTLRATLRRRGEWHNLEYSHHLSYGARAVMAKKIDSGLAAFRVLLGNLKQTDDFTLACDFLEQIEVFFEAGVQEVLSELQVAGPAAFEERLANAQDVLWGPCLKEWGSGRGFRDRVKDRNSEWFEKMEDVSTFLQGFFQEKWDQLLSKLGSVLDSSSEQDES